MLSRASFRRPPLSAARKTFMVSVSTYKQYLHQKNGVLQKKVIPTIRAVMLGEHVDLVAGCALPTPPGPAPLWEPGSIPGCWADVLRVPDTARVRPAMESPTSRALSSNPHKALGLRPTDQSCHREIWLHLDFVDWRSAQSHHDRQDRRILLKERPAPYHYGQQKRCINDIMSDHSLSS